MAKSSWLGTCAGNAASASLANFADNRQQEFRSAFHATNVKLSGNSIRKTRKKSKGQRKKAMKQPITSGKPAISGTN
ncbi:hypothetical protein [Rubripirellula reticaptiva]|uniref:hypothetical protein n=1 Tax=Rubripirellula reticaptiva TaxID=2528013 RepID=UPI0011B756F4|nr:hypothetical protein [Rubripirellula reticaptiva]